MPRARSFLLPRNEMPVSMDHKHKDGGFEMRTKVLFVVLAAVLFTVPVVGQNRAARTTLDIYVVDVEGGNAVLFVTPSGESVLIDSGNAGAGAARDAGRIMDAVHDAGLKQIDHLIITHYHGDHIG